ncbi:MAG: hypothetical protein ACM31L_08710 [Actinomycetota bacterium]
MTVSGDPDDSFYGVVRQFHLAAKLYVGAYMDWRGATPGDDMAERMALRSAGEAFARACRQVCTHPVHTVAGFRAKLDLIHREACISGFDDNHRDLEAHELAGLLLSDYDRVFGRGARPVSAYAMFPGSPRPGSVLDQGA